VTVWLSGYIVGHVNEIAALYAEPAGTKICDRSWVYTILVFNQATPGQLSLAIPSWVGEMSTGDGKKRRVLRNSRLCYQGRWHTV